MSDEEPTFATAKGGASIQDRIAAFDMLDRMGDATQAQKIFRLELVGFSRIDIAGITGASADVIKQSVYAERKKLKPKAAKRTTASKPEK